MEANEGVGESIDRPERDVEDVKIGSSYMVIETHNKQNIGTVLRCAVAFGIDTMVVIGSPKFGTHGAHGSQKYIRVMHFFYWENFYRYAREHDVHVLHISRYQTLASATKAPLSVHKYMFDVHANVAFCLFPQGIPEDHITNGDDILYVEYPRGAECEDLVNYDATVSICLQQFRRLTARAVLETAITKEKFQLGSKLRDGIIYMDTAASVSIEEICRAEEEDFGFSMFLEDSHII